jgi:hypothetical protein
VLGFQNFCLPFSSLLSTEMVLMHWIRNYGFGPHFIDWLAVAVVVLVTIALRIGTRRLVFWLLTHKRDSGKDEKEYWRIHEG